MQSESDRPEMGIQAFTTQAAAPCSRGLFGESTGALSVLVWPREVCPELKCIPSLRLTQSLESNLHTVLQSTCSTAVSSSLKERHFSDLQRQCVCMHQGREGSLPERYCLKRMSVFLYLDPVCQGQTHLKICPLWQFPSRRTHQDYRRNWFLFISWGWTEKRVKVHVG